MKGLKEGWQSLPRVHIAARTTSASGPAREDQCDAISLQDALENPAARRVIVRGEDGMALAIRAQDVHDAYLAPLQEGGWQLFFARDATRRRRLKHPALFLSE